MQALEETEELTGDTGYVSVVVRACSIVESDLSHELTLFLDSTGMFSDNLLQIIKYILGALTY